MAPAGNALIIGEKGNTINIALSKKNFAEKIATRQAPFEN
jgi:hypothetical protein